MRNGLQLEKVDEEWKDYLAELDRLGLQEWLKKIKQAGYDRNKKIIDV
ncbi:hypothetical protein GCM10020331_102790 [Ectobacillus funiculus]